MDSSRALILARVLAREMFSRIISAAGVTNKVKMTAKLKPKTTADDICAQYWAAGAPTATVRSMKSISTPITMGIKPAMVVTVVSRIGRRRICPARNKALCAS